VFGRPRLGRHRVGIDSTSVSVGDANVSIVSIETARWLLDDANAAFHDPDHPCHRFCNTQDTQCDHLTWEQWQLPVPFLGRQAKRGLLFLGFNPSFGGEVGSPRGGISLEAYYRYWSDLPDSAFAERQAQLYQRYTELGELGADGAFQLGSDALAMDAIPYRSATGWDAWSPEIWNYLKDRYTGAVLRECAPRVVVTSGAWALWCLRDLVADLASTLPEALRLRDWQGKVLTVATEWGEASVLPLPHLTAAFGVSRDDRSEFGRRLHEVLSTSTHEEIDFGRG